MITFAAPEDKEAIYQIWKEMFSHDDGGYTDYYFQYLYDEAITYVWKENHEVRAVLQRIRHTVALQGNPINTSMILGVATLPAYQGQGYMHKLMKEALKDAAKEEIVTMIQAYHPEMYYPFGFVPYYYHKEYVYQPMNISIKGELGKGNEHQYLSLYRDMMKDFEGYIMRDIHYYQQLSLELEAQAFTLIGYFEAGIMCAYAIMEGNLISECVGPKDSRMCLLELLYQKYGSIRVRVMCDQCSGTIDTMLLFHNWNDALKILHTDCKDSKTYMESLHKPLFIHEYA